MGEDRGAHGHMPRARDALKTGSATAASANQRARLRDLAGRRRTFVQRSLARCRALTYNPDMGRKERYKRNQVEAAVIATLQGNADADGPDLRVRIKRLLDADRNLPPEHASEEGRYAFFSGESPGSGVEVWFSAYEAFALLLGLRILAHGWPQGSAVRILRRVRKDLEDAHRRIRAQDPAALFDPVTVRRQGKPGVISTGSAAPVFLAITSAEGARDLKGFAVCDGQQELMKFILKVMPIGLATTSLELTGSAHRLARQLAQTQPRRRGRAG
jgi:hypothetical protein